VTDYYRISKFLLWQVLANECAKTRIEHIHFAYDVFYRQGAFFGPAFFFSNVAIGGGIERSMHFVNRFITPAIKHANYPIRACHSRESGNPIITMGYGFRLSAMLRPE